MVFTFQFTVRGFCGICLKYLLYGEICEKNEMEIKLFLFQKGDFIMDFIIIMDFIMF